MATQLRVVIPTAGRSTLLKRTLESLAACEKPAIYRETIVVENGPPGGVREVAAACGARYQYVEQPNKSNALNVILSDLEDDCLIYFTDDDVRLEPNVLTRYAEAATDIESGVFWGGSMAADYEVAPPEWLVPLLPPDAREFTESDYRRGSGYLVFLGCNWAAFAGDLRKAGGFDARFGPGGNSGSIGQESEMQQRLLSAKIEPRFLGDAKVWHYVPPERCSPNWVARRCYRFGILDAIARGIRPTNRLRLPIWQWRRVVRQSLRYLATRVHPNKATRFKARMALNCELGMARGAWILSRRPKASQDGA